MFKPQRIIPVALFLLILALTGCVASYIYYPKRDIRLTPRALGLPYTDVTLETSDGIKINAWWVPALSPRATVLFCHGNGGNISSYLETLAVFHRLGLSALIFDYRGYGNSQGTPSEQGTYLDAEAAWRYLIDEQKTAPQQLIIWGRSLGGAVAARTAARHPAGMLVLESAFTSVPEVAHEHFAWLPDWFFARYRYETRRYLEQVRAPTLVIHSPEDEIIAFAHGRRLFEAVKGHKAFLTIKGSHNQGFIDSRALYEPGIEAFIRRYATPSQEPAQ